MEQMEINLARLIEEVIIG